MKKTTSSPKQSSKPAQIRLIGVKQNNLKNLNVDFNIGELTVVTGPSGSGKSSLVFDTLYAEGQRRYVETFSAYARQFLDRMDKPLVDKIEGVPPAIAIDQTNPVRTSRSSVGTMTELNDHLKLLFARAAQLFDRETAQPVLVDSPDTVYAALQQQLSTIVKARLIITFPVTISSAAERSHTEEMLQAAGFVRIHAARKVAKKRAQILDVVVDRLLWPVAQTSRLMQALEQAFTHGKGRLNLYLQIEEQEPQRLAFSQQLHCPQSDISYAQPSPSLFSFNSAQGACPDCRGFGRVIGVDYGLVVPNQQLSLTDGAIKVFQTPAWQEQQEDLIRYAKAAKIPCYKPWRQLTPAQQHWVLHGASDWTGKWKTQWYGVERFFDYLESKAYKMHIRVLLSKYRSYTTCPSCAGARLQNEALLWRVGSQANADAVLPREQRFMPQGVSWSAQQLSQLPGLSLHDLMLLPLSKLQQFFNSLELKLSAAEQQAIDLVLTEIRQRLNYLVDVGVGYLTLDRQSRTLSGGEVQRINLTTALGTSLVNTLFVLDEPSIGLHPHDMQAVIRAMHGLRNSGNTLVVVEHDPAIMLQADRIIDMGPGPGADGGQIVFDGSAAQLRQAPTLTGQYLAGKQQISFAAAQAVTAKTPRLTLTGVKQHNLKDLTIAIPLQRLVCLTGVSGSGKSTLVQQVLVPALARHFGKATETPGEFDQLLGAEQLADVVFVDQSPLGKTARSNPVSYVGAWTSIRALLAQTPMSKQRGYTSAKFSFNSGDGRCPSCSGSGYEHIEMQFLSDVYLQCPECLGSRYRPEVLEVKLQRQQQQLNVAQILALTITQARQFFATDLAVLAALQPLEEVGLGYLKLGQPVPTLSGGEAQRLKLAGYLNETGSLRSKTKQNIAHKGSLFVFDEPTTGLHFSDIAKLMQALQRLVAVGHSLLVIEHNLDVLQAADWLIDLGPEGGENGGYLQAEGSPAQLRESGQTHTAQALRDYQHSLSNGAQVAETAAAYALNGSQNRLAQHGATAIEIVNAREHNLQSLSVNIPRGKFNVITGVSGSGKSTLAFDILFHEGQRRYLESLNAYARSLVQPASRPDVAAVYGIAPTVAIEQRLSRGGNKSTVGTVTEIWHFLRLLYVKLGVQHCINDGSIVQPQTQAQILTQIQRSYQQQEIALLAPLVVGRKGSYKELFVWARQQGFAWLRVDGSLLSTDKSQRLDRYKEHNIELVVATFSLEDSSHAAQLSDWLATALEHGKGVVQILSLDKTAAVQTFSVKRACPSCSQSYAELDPRLFSYNSKHGWCVDCVGTGLKLAKEQRQSLDDSQIDRTQNREQSFNEPDLTDLPAEICPGCNGGRLNPTAQAVLFRQQSIVEIARYTVVQLADWVASLQLTTRESNIAKPILQEISARLQFLQQVGLNYLTLDRGAPTLSGGEAQRIRLAAQLGSNLQGVCYILDEPTIGLHPRDNQRLLATLQQLNANNNTLVVVEHDEETIRQAQHLIDIGPGAGSKGGQLVAQGTVEDIEQAADSQTGQYLRQPMQHPLQAWRRVSNSKKAAADGLAWLTLKQAQLFNLQNISLKLPLQRLVAITGVSGSGKSTLAREVLFPNLQRAVANKLSADKTSVWHGCSAISGYESIDRVLEVDQTPIGKTSRSCPATYVGFWDQIRQLLAQTLEAKASGYTASRFSFNVAQGRCSSCHGHGVRTIALSFLPDVKVLCESCNGQRFNAETLTVRWQGKNIGEILQLSVDEAVEFFRNMPKISHPLQLLKDVGLGYLTLGQPSPTLSGGEAQRIKLVTELSKVRDDITRRGQKAPHTLYLLDEPTVGLHMADVEKLLRVLHRLVDAGHSVVVVEHDLDLIAEADWIIDLGPEGGSAGGNLVAQGSPTQLVRKFKTSYTAQALQPVLQRGS